MQCPEVMTGDIAAALKDERGLEEHLVEQARQHGYSQLLAAMRPSDDVPQQAE
jgi:hypothetical protein